MKIKFDQLTISTRSNRWVDGTPYACNARVALSFEGKEVGHIDVPNYEPALGHVLVLKDITGEVEASED